jgi:hypothetical protein
VGSRIEKAGTAPRAPTSLTSPSRRPAPYPRLRLAASQPPSPSVLALRHRLRDLLALVEGWVG